MKKQITRISPVQTSKVVAFLYASFAVITVPVGIVFLLIGGRDGHNRALGLTLILVPFFYAAAGFVLGLIGTAIYNFIAKRFGGFEFTVTEVADRQP